MRELINYKRYRKIAVALLIVFIILFMLPKLLITTIETIDRELLNYRFMPILWGSFLFIFFRFIPRVHPIGRYALMENIYMESVVCAALLIGIQFLAGSMIGQMGESPYILTPKGILNNLLYSLPPLIARESIRSYILSSFHSKANVKVFILVTVLLLLTDVRYAELSTLTNIKEFTIFLGEEVGPLLCQHIMLSYLALYGGSVAAMSYIGIITLFEWTSPILPVLNWLTKGAIGILVPIFSLMLIIKKYECRVSNVKQIGMKKWEGVQWIFTAVFSIGLIWFVIGVFPVVPSVIATGSMEPLIYPGDIVLLKQVRSEDQVFDLKKGDIIQFQRGEVRITHRIIDIQTDKSGKFVFHTKGDNNSVADTQTVDPNDIKGIYYKVIPKLGYPTLLLKGRSATEVDEVEF